MSSTLRAREMQALRSSISQRYPASFATCEMAALRDGRYPGPSRKLPRICKARCRRGHASRSTQKSLRVASCGRSRRCIARNPMSTSAKVDQAGEPILRHPADIFARNEIRHLWAWTGRSGPKHRAVAWSHGHSVTWRRPVSRESRSAVAASRSGCGPLGCVPRLRLEAAAAVPGTRAPRRTASHAAPAFAHVFSNGQSDLHPPPRPPGGPTVTNIRTVHAPA